MTAKTEKRTRQEPTIIGWREDISLPALGLGRFPAKIDTGALTAALHATNVYVDEHEVVFTVTIRGREHRCRCPMMGWKRVRSSNGQSEERPVIETDVKIGKLRFVIEVTLTDRTDMGVAMLLGRSSLGAGFLVNPTKSHILAPRKRSTP